ncbi:hypothetical protein L0F63_000262 [Massospora cicadina]|nr:hypothetical protein L0F63_000262 [Massospora cicadina]
MRPLAAQPQLPRLSNEPQFIKPFPEEPPKGFNDNQFFFNQGLSNFSSGQQSLNSSNKTSRNFEFKRSSPSLENFDNNEDSSRSPRKGKRPRKYVRSGKYSKLKQSCFSFCRVRTYKR